jgi:transposase
MGDGRERAHALDRDHARGGDLPDRGGSSPRPAPRTPRRAIRRHLLLRPLVAYNQIDPESRQACWSHLQGDFRFHAEGLPVQKLFGEQGLKLTSRLFEAWHAYQQHEDRARLEREIDPVKAELRELLEKAGRKTPRNKYHRGFANNLLKIWPALWTFVSHEGVEPTNNAAERSLRGPVIHRKLSHGTRSHDGERFVERALSASVTCRLQKRSLFAYLTNLLTADARGDPLPTLT